MIRWTGGSKTQKAIRSISSGSTAANVFESLRWHNDNEVVLENENAGKKRKRKVEQKYVYKFKNKREPIFSSFC